MPAKPPQATPDRLPAATADLIRVAVLSGGPYSTNLPRNTHLSPSKLCLIAPPCFKNVLKGPRYLRGYGQRPSQRKVSGNTGATKALRQIPESSSDIQSRPLGLSLVMPGLLQKQPGIHSCQTVLFLVTFWVVRKTPISLPSPAQAPTTELHLLSGLAQA